MKDKALILKALSDKTGFGMDTCHKAMNACKWQEDFAIEWLRVIGTTGGSGKLREIEARALEQESTK